MDFNFFKYLRLFVLCTVFLNIFLFFRDSCKYSGSILPASLAHFYPLHTKYKSI